MWVTRKEYEVVEDSWMNRSTVRRDVMTGLQWIGQDRRVLNYNKGEKGIRPGEPKKTVSHC